MRFAIVTQYFPPEVGAPQIRLLAIARQLTRLNHEVIVITAMPNYPVGKVFPEYRGRWFAREELDGIRVIRIGAYTATGRGLGRLVSYLSFSLSAFYGILRCPKPDVIFVESPPPFLGFAGWLGSIYHRSHFFLNISDLWPDSIEALGILSRRALKPMFMLEKLLYGTASLICGTTRGIVRRLIEDKGVPETKVLHLPNGADLEELSPRPKDYLLSEQLNLDLDRKVFLFAGTHGYAQGLHSVVETASLLRRTDIQFLFVGEGPDKPRLQSLVEERKLSNITFIPAQPFSKIAQFFSLATASVVPLIKTDLFLDALPSKLVASLACGVPPIFTGDGEAAQVIREGQCGMVVAPEDPAALASAVERLADDPVLRSSLALNARQLAVDSFSWEQIVDSWLKAVIDRIEHLDERIPNSD